MLTTPLSLLTLIALILIAYNLKQGFELISEKLDDILELLRSHLK